VDTPEHGEPVFAFGKEPLGHFIFTAGGHVAFSMMRNPPHIDETTSDPDPDACVPGWYCAYFGTYEVDARRGVGAQPSYPVRPTLRLSGRRAGPCIRCCGRTWAGASFREN